MKQEDWENLNGDSNPFLNFHFFKALENSRCIGPGTGWGPVILKNQDGFLPLYNKTNSHGEYIFDWSWADAYHRNGEAYYPKLTSMVPFTPVTSGHFLQKHFSEAVAHQLLDLAEEYYQAANYSSLHFLFLTNEEKKFFEKRNYLLRESFQYHFFNQGYAGFEDFLSELKTKKVKQIRKERSFPTLKIEQITGADLSEEHAERMYHYYMRTIAEKNSFAYLNRDFFVNVFRTMKKNILMVEAYKDEKPVAASLFFYNEDKLYGRYWGSVAEFPYLHFELCYYQGIDFCLKHKLQVFEAGAQGEHKISRGFRPVTIYSAHKLKSAPFQEAIRRFIIQEKQQVREIQKELSTRLPFK